MHFSFVIFLRYLVVCLLLSLSLSAVSSQQQNLRFNRLTTGHGVSSDSITAFLQDRQGFMWIGTQSGLNRFDGYHAKVYKNKPDEPNSLSDNWVTALLEDESGRIWIGTRSGLQYFDDATDTFVKAGNANEIGNANAKFHVTAIVGEWSGRKEKTRGLWLATNAGLKHLNVDTGYIETWQHDENRAESIFSNTLNALAWDGKGRLWIGRSKGLDTFVPGTKRFEHFSTDNATVFTLLYGSNNTLWVGTRSGLEVWNLAMAVPTRERVVFDGNSVGWVLSLAQDQKGVVWVGTEANGLYRIGAQNASPRNYKREAKDSLSLGSNSIYSLYQDRGGSLWVGTWTAGVNTSDLTSGGFARFDHLVGDPSAMDDERINTVSIDRSNRMWLGTADGLALFDSSSGKLKVYRHNSSAKSLSDNWVQTIYEAKNRQLWVGTKQGLAKFNQNSGEFTNRRFSEQELLANWIYKIIEDDDGSLWLATLAGLYHFDPATEKIQSFRHRAGDTNSISDDRIVSILKDKEGKFWIATLSGLDQMDVKTGRIFHVRHLPMDKSSLIGDGIVNLLEDKNGRIWIVTSNGLSRYESVHDGIFHFKSYSNADGIVGDPVGAILQDKKSNLWFTTTAGVSQLSTDTGKMKNYSSSDGLLKEYSNWSSGAIDAEGKFYFGSDHGLTQFFPEEIMENSIQPQIVISDLQIFNRSIVGAQRPEGVEFDGSIQTAKSLTLSYLNSVFSLEFSALHFADSARNQYAYQLVGFDRDWVRTDSTRRLATYTNLDPGHYVFRVKGSNNSGVWNETGARLDIIITPPFWKTSWFRLLLVMLFLIAGFSIYRFRIRHLIRQKKVLKSQVALRTRELEEQKEMVEKAHDNISQLSEIGREITAALDVTVVMANVQRYVSELMPLDELNIGIFRESKNEIEINRFAVSGISTFKKNINDSDQVCVWCIKQKKEFFLGDAETPLNVTMFQENSHRSVIAVPMIVKDRVLGVLRVSSEQLNVYQRIHLDMLIGLAAYAAIALDNAETYLKLQNAQKKLVEQEKMIALGSLVVGVAHEMNTPIGNSLLAASALSEESILIRSKLEINQILRSELNLFISRVQESSALIVRGLNSAANLVDSFKRVSIIRDNETQEIFDLREYCQRLVSTKKQLILNSGHSIVLDIPEGISMNSYPGPFGQVIIGFIDNALAHAFHGRTGGEMLICAEKKNEHVQILFQDNGSGISSENLSRVFDPFFTTKLGRGGTGLGLSISFNIVSSLLDGQISVTSEPGMGATFTLYLPLQAN